jgi:hypothetical protein
MDKLAVEKQLKQDLAIIEEQETKIAQQTETIATLEKTKDNEEFVGLRNFKLAYDIAELMTAKELSAPEDFQEAVNILMTKNAEELTQRHNLLKVSDVESALDLGTVDEGDGSKIATEPISATPHSPESSTAAQNLIDSINNN